MVWDNCNDVEGSNCEMNGISVKSGKGDDGMESSNSVCGIE